MKWKFDLDYFLHLCYLVSLEPDLSRYRDYRRRFYNNHPHWRGVGEISAHFTRKCKSARNANYYVTLEELWRLFLSQKGRCALSGLKIWFAEKCKDEHLITASVDRIDSSGDYTMDNIQFVHKNVNYMKNVLSNDKFINWCKLISEYNYG